MFRRYVEDQPVDRRISHGGSAAEERRRHRPARPAGTAPPSGACCATPPTPAGPPTLKTGRVDGTPALNRTARRQGRSMSCHARTRPRPSRGVDRDRRARHRRRGHLHRCRSPAGGQPPLRGPQHQRAVRCSWAWSSCAELRLRLLPDLHPHQDPQALLLPLPRLRRLPLRARPHVHQPAGARRLPRRARVGPSHCHCSPTPASCKPSSTVASPSCAPRTRPPSSAPGSNSNATRATKSIERLVLVGYQEELRHPRRAARHGMPDLRAKDSQPARIPRRSLEAQLLRPRHLPEARRGPRRLPRAGCATPPMSATIEARQKVLRSVVKESPRRTRTCHHPPLDPGGRSSLSTLRLSVAFEASSGTPAGSPPPCR